MMRLLIYIALLWGIVFYGSLSHAKNIKLVTGTDYAPYTSPDILEGGVVTDVVSTVFKEMGYVIDLQFYPWNRGLKRVSVLQSDATFPYAHTVERDKNFYFSRPINRLTVSIFQRVNTGRIYRSPSDLVGLTYCQPLGYKTEDELVSLLDALKINRFRANTVDSCLERLGAGRADFVALNSSVVWAAAKRIWGGKEQGIIEEAEVLLNTSTEHLIISRKYPQGQKLIDEFNITYQRLLDLGVIKEIWAKHLGDLGAPAM